MEGLCRITWGAFTASSEWWQTERRNSFDSDSPWTRTRVDREMNTILAVIMLLISVRLWQRLIVRAVPRDRGRTLHLVSPRPLSQVIAAPCWCSLCAEK